MTVCKSMMRRTLCQRKPHEVCIKLEEFHTLSLKENDLCFDLLFLDLSMRALASSVGRRDEPILTNESAFCDTAAAAAAAQ